MRAADWTGGIGDTWAREWRRTDRSFAGLDLALERAIFAGASAGSIVAVDLGCGAGTTSLAIAAALPEAEVIGLDLSAQLIGVAEHRARAEGRASACRFVHGDAIATVAALAPVDLFFSRHGVMFFDDPVAAFTSLAVAATPGAALVFSCFAAIADNDWATAPLGLVPPSPHAALEPEPGPFAFADPHRVGSILAAAGWSATAPERVTFRYVAGAGGDPIDDALSFFRRIGPVARTLRDADERDRPALLDHIAVACERYRDGDEVAFPATAWLWSAHLKESAR